MNNDKEAMSFFSEKCIYLFERGGERDWGVQRGKAEGEKERILSRLFAEGEPKKGHDPRTLRSPPKRKPSVRCSTYCTNRHPKKPYSEDKRRKGKKVESEKKFLRGERE